MTNSLNDNVYYPPELSVTKVKVEHGFFGSVTIGVTGNGDDGAFGPDDINTGVPDFFD